MEMTYRDYCDKDKKEKILVVEYLDGGYIASGEREYVLNLLKYKCPEQYICKYASECEFLKKIKSSIKK